MLRDVINIEQRSIITALEELICKRHDMHVTIQADSINQYDRFEIDNILERLKCLFESFLIYSKAQFHAFISFILSDLFIDRIDAEETLYTFKSNYNQSWTTLDIKSVFILEAIEALSSKKEYYSKKNDVYKRLIEIEIWSWIFKMINIKLLFKKY